MYFNSSYQLPSASSEDFMEQVGAERGGVEQSRADWSRLVGRGVGGSAGWGLRPICAHHCAPWLLAPQLFIFQKNVMKLQLQMERCFSELAGTTGTRPQ